MIVVYHGLDEIHAQVSAQSQFRMYFFINTKTGEDPSEIDLAIENIIIFQSVENAPELFIVFEKKEKRMKRFHLWDGHKFWDNNFVKRHTLIRTFKNEVVRVASGPLMPFAFILTLPNGKRIIRSGALFETLRVIAALDQLKLTYVDALHEEGKLWGTLYKNGTSTGMIKLILEHRADFTLPILCGARVHRNLACSTTVAFDGFIAFLLKPKPLPSWQGLLLPFDLPTWFATLATVIVTTLILGFCTKYSLKQENVDWTLHFLDAFHPMCGRNMAVPGFNAAHLGRE